MDNYINDRKSHHVDKSIPVDDMTYKELQSEAMDCDLPANLKLIEMKTMLKAKRAGDEHVVGNILSQYRERRTNSRKNKRASLKPSTTPERKNKRKRVKSRQEDFIYSPVSEGHCENPSSYTMLPTSSTSSNYRMAVQCDRSQRSKKVMKTATDTAAKQAHYENPSSYSLLPTSSTSSNYGSSNYRMAVPCDNSQTSKKVMKTATDTAAKQTNALVSVPQQQPRNPTLRELLQSTPCMPHPSPNHFNNYNPKLSGVISLPKHPTWPPVREMRGEDMPIDTLHYTGSSSTPTYNMQAIGQAQAYDLSSGRRTATASNMYSSLASYQKIPPTYTYCDTPNQLPQNANQYETAMMVQVPERQHLRLDEDTMLQFPERPYLRWDDNSMVPVQLPEKPYHKWNENNTIQFPERLYNNQNENDVVHVPPAYNAGETIIPDPLPPFYSLFGEEVSKKLPLPYNRGESTISVPSPVECNEVLPMESLINMVPGYDHNDDKATSSVPYPQCNTVLPSYPPPYGRNADTTSEQPWSKFAPGYSLNNNTMQIPSVGLPPNCTRCSSVMPVCPPTYSQNANTLAEQSSLKLPLGYSSYDYTEPVGSVGSQLPSLYDQRNSVIPIYPPKFGQNANTLQHPSLATNTKREHGLLSETLMRQNSMPQNRLYGQNINTVPEDQHSTLVTRHKREQVLLSETLTVSRLNGMPQNVLYGQNMPEKQHSTLATRRKHDQAFLSGTQTNPSRNSMPQNWLYSQNVNTIPGEQPSLLVNKNKRMRSLLSEPEMQSGIDFMIQNALFGENLNTMQDQFSSVVTKRKRAAVETVTSSTLKTTPENRSYGSNVSNVNTVLLEQPSTLNISAKPAQELPTHSRLNTIPPKGSYDSNLSSTPLEQPSTLNNNSKPAQDLPTHLRLNTIPQKGSYGSNLSSTPLEQPSTLNNNSKPAQELPTYSRLSTIPQRGSFGSNLSTTTLEHPSTLNNNSKPEQALSTETITDSKLNGKPQNEKPANTATPVGSIPSAAGAEVRAADTTQELDFDGSETLEVESPSLLEDPWWNPDNTEKQQQPNFHHNNELSYPLIYSYLASTEEQLKEQEGEKQRERETEPEACPSTRKQPDVPAEVEVEVEVVDGAVLDEAMVELICGDDKKKKEQEEEARELDRPLASSTPKEGSNPDQIDILPVPVKEVPPLSEAMLKEIRNYAKTVQLEDRQERYDCVNRDRGCPRAGMGKKEFEHHKQICLLQPFKCFNGCKWKGTMKDFRTHLYKLHSNSILRGTESSQSVSMHVVRLNRNVMFLRKVINRLFVLTVQCHGHLVYVTIQHLPPWKDKHVKMFARLEVVGMNGKRLGWSGKVKPMYIPSESMWNSKQCLVVDPAVIGAIAGSSLLIHDMITVYRVKDDTSHESDSD